MSDFNTPMRSSEYYINKNAYKDKHTLNRSYDQQAYFQKLQTHHDTEERNQRINDKYQQQKNDREQNKLFSNIQTENDLNERQSTKARTSTNIDQNNDATPVLFNPQRRNMKESKSALIQQKKQYSGFQTPNDALGRFNVSPARQQQNHSLPPIESNKKTNGSSPSKSTYTTPKHQYQNEQQQNFQAQPQFYNKSERRIRGSEVHLNQIYQGQRDPQYIHYDMINSYHPYSLYHSKIYQQKKREDEEFRKKLINQNEKLMQMFQQMQRNHQEEINILKLREKHTLKMIRQQQEQIDLQNRKIECRDMPPPNFFLAPLQF